MVYRNLPCDFAECPQNVRANTSEGLATMAAVRSRKLDYWQEPLGSFSWVWIFNWFVLRAVPAATVCVTAYASFELLFAN